MEENEDIQDHEPEQATENMHLPVKPVVAQSQPKAPTVTVTKSDADRITALEKDLADFKSRVHKKIAYL